jgi:hypothetical protein
MKNTANLILILVAAILAGCAGAQVSSGDASASILEPLNNSQYALGETVHVRTNVSNPAGTERVVLLANGEAVRVDELDAPLLAGRMVQGWLPLNPGEYELQVFFYSADGAQLLSDKITITVGTEINPENLIDLDVTEEPIAEDLPSVTPAFDPPIATANVDANCRAGTFQVFPILGNLLTSQSAPIVGRLADNSFWVIDLGPNGGHCWVWDELVTVTGDISGVPVLTPPATPTPTPEPLPAPSQTAPTGDVSCASLLDVTFSWQPVAGDVDHYSYEIQAGSSDTGPFNGYSESDTDSTSATVELVCGSSNFYRWRVRAEANSGESGAWSGWIVFRAGP